MPVHSASPSCPSSPSSCLATLLHQRGNSKCDGWKGWMGEGGCCHFGRPSGRPICQPLISRRPLQVAKISLRHTILSPHFRKRPRPIAASRVTALDFARRAAVSLLHLALPIVFLIVASLSSARAQDSPTASAATTNDPCTPLAASNNFLLGTVANVTIVPGDQVIACYSSFSIDRATRLSHVDALKRFFGLYPYLDIAKSSATPNYPSNVDLFATLDNIANDDTITREFQFHTKIVEAVASLNDAHSYYGSYCYLSARFAQPFIIDAKHSGNGIPPVIYVRDSFASGSTLFSGGGSMASSLAAAYKAYWSPFLNGDASTYIGYTIKTINGLDALTYIQKFADRWTGVSHSQETRFNSFMLSATYSSGKFVLTDGSLYRTRSVPFDLPTVMTYELVSPTGASVMLSVPWGCYVKTQSGTAFTDRDSYYQQNCVSANTPRSTPAQASASAANSANGSSRLSDFLAVAQISVPDFEDVGIKERKPAVTTSHLSFKADPAIALTVHKNQVAKVASAKRTDRLAGLVSTGSAANTGFSLSSPLLSDNHGAFYMLDATTGVWAFTTVQPTDLTDATLNGMIGTITSGLLTLEQSGAQRLIIDTTGNGGGIICLGEFVLQYLLNKPVPLPYDIRLSDSMAALTKYADYTKVLTSKGLIFSTNGLSPFKGGTANILTNTNTATRGGTTTTYSDKFSLDCSAFTKPFLSTLPALNKGWSPNAMFIVSDGNCGSTCAEFTRVLRDEYGIQAFSYGGSSGSAFQPSSFEGGSVGSFDTILSNALTIANSTPILSSTSALLPVVPFTLPATGSVPVWESFSPAGRGGLDVPVEWVPQPADKHLAVTDATDRAAVWMAAATAAGNPTNNGKAAGTPKTTSGADTTKRTFYCWLCHATLTIIVTASLIFESILA
ncbi:hypothetical protein DFJ73DRAFT_851762 [Zopfochytrium polystomum]|nr:hypothetical protein DFJ73DRAFT_851762 [Zopfochytrium polystomum]